MYRVFPVLALLMIPSLAVAQTYAGQDSDTPRSDRIAAETAPGVAAANRAVAGRSGQALFVNPDDQAAYAADLRVYEDARRARRRVIYHEQAYYDRQQRAYASAMAEWRAQTRACRRGSNRACERPTPQPGDYM